MKTCASCKAEKARDGFGACRSRPDGLNPYCKDCARAKGRVATAKWNAKNPGYAARKLAEKRSNPEYREAQRARAREAYQANREQVLASKRDYMRANWRKYRKPETAAACKARYRASLLNATPAWADQKAITAFYAQARRISQKTGTIHHVDHIVPLQGENVCGLHVGWNLQILTGSANQSKSNRLVAA